MRNKNFKVSCLLGSALLSLGMNVFAADQAQTQIQDQVRDQAQQQVQSQDQKRIQDQVQTRDREKIYGSQMMTSAERAEYRAKMRGLKTRQEREAYRLEHHKRMQQRANERGLQLPDSPPAGGKGMGPGGGGRHGR